MPTVSKFFGRNGLDSPTEINDSECVTLVNMHISGSSLSLRKGMQNANTSFGADPVWGLHRSYLVDGSPYWFASTGDKVKSDKTGSWADIKTLSESNKGVGFVEGGGSVWILPANTTDKVQKSDGTAGGTTNHPDADCPKASIGIFSDNRLYLNDLNNFGRVYFSDTNNTDVFREQDSSATATDGGFVEISKGDGDRIRGIGTLGSIKFIFKERSIHMLLGTSFTGSEEFRRVQVAKGTGTRSPRSVVTVENGLMFLDSDGLLRYFHGPSRRILSNLGMPLEDLTKNIPSGLLEEACGAYFDRKFWFSFASSGGTKNDQLWSMDMRIITETLESDKERVVRSGWTKHESNAATLGGNIFQVTNGQSDELGIYYGDSGIGIIREFETGTRDLTVAIPYEWKSKAYGVDEPGVTKNLSEFRTVTRTNVGSVTHKVYKDLSSTAVSEKNIAAYSSVYSVNSYGPSQDALGSVLQVGFSGSSGSGFECLAVQWDWGPKRKEPKDG